MDRQDLKNAKWDIVEDILERIEDTGSKAFPTRIIWKLVAMKKKGVNIQINYQDIIDIANTLFPGFRHIEPKQVILCYEIPIKLSLFNQHPKMIDYDTVDDAIKVFGEEVLIYSVKPYKEGELDQFEKNVW